MVRFQDPPGVVVNLHERRRSRTCALSEKTAQTAPRAAQQEGRYKGKEVIGDGGMSDSGQGDTVREKWLRLPFSRYEGAKCLLVACCKAAVFCD